MNVRADHGRGFNNFRTPLGDAFRPIQCPLIAEFLKIDTFTKPVIIVMADLQFVPAEEHGFDKRAVAAVVANDGALVNQ